MRRCRKVLAATLCAGLSLALANNSANAACATLAGTWYFYDMQGSSPNIRTNVTSVVVGPTMNTHKNLESFTFTNTDKGYDNNTSSIIKCTMTVKANGSFSAPCVSYAPDGTHNTNVTGQLTLTAACDLSGTINAGDPTLVTIQGAHVNGNVGAGIATQGLQFHHFSLIKK